MNGLNIRKEEFVKMPPKQQNLILFENTEQIKGLLKSDLFHRKIQYVWLSSLTAGIVWAAKWLLERI